MTQPPKSASSPATYIEQNILLLVCALPLLIPFGLVRNIALQAALVCLMGVLAGVALWQRRRDGSRKALDRKTTVLLSIYTICICLSFVINPSLANLLGTQLTRLGAVELLACVAIGLSLRHLPALTVKRWLYISICLVAITSIVYTQLHTHGWSRIGGILFQADLLAVLVGVGLILGVSLFAGNRYKPALVLMQIILVITLLLTQTRAVMGILLLLAIFSSLYYVRTRRTKLRLLLLLVGVLLLCLLGAQAIGGNRITDRAFAAQSTSYRVDLQRLGIHHLSDRPVFGYGAGHVRRPLSCARITAPSLVLTCQQGRYFNSSHNIFLDRMLALGWLGGLSFLALCVMLLWSGLKKSSTERSFALCAALIVLYYFTNITGITVELLLWICLLRLTLTDNSGNRAKNKIDNHKHDGV